jgi:hypothetical protein
MIAGIGTLAAAQFSIPTLFGADGYLHIRMAHFLRDFGPRYPFHWARFSVFAEHFADKDFLYHLALIPFTYLPGFVFSAKAAALSAAVALFAGYFFLLRRYSLPWLVPFFLALFFLSPAYVQALCRPRPMVVMILLTLLFVHCAIRRRALGLFFLGVVFTLMHVSSPLWIFFILLIEWVRGLGEGVMCWKHIGVTLAGIVCGFALHPNFPDNFTIFYLNGILVPLFAMTWGLELGAEFFPLDTRAYAIQYPWVIIGFVVFGVLAASKGNRMRFETRVWMVMAGFFFVLSFFSKRYAIHAYPAILLFLASYISDWWQGGERLLWLRRRGRVAVGISVLACVCVVSLSGCGVYRGFRELAGNEQAWNSHYEMCAAWMNENIPPGETVFHANWSDAQYFIGLSPQHDYFVTLDPIFMYQWDKEKYRLYRDIAFGRVDDVAASLGVFNVRYGYAGKDYFGALIERVRGDPRFEIMAENGMGAFFRLK